MFVVIVKTMAYALGAIYAALQAHEARGARRILPIVTTKIIAIVATSIAIDRISFLRSFGIIPS